MKIEKPQFELYEKVYMDWNGEKITKIVARWYELDKKCWWYKKSNDETFYPESAFNHIYPHFAHKLEELCK